MKEQRLKRKIAKEFECSKEHAERGWKLVDELDNLVGKSQTDIFLAQNGLGRAIVGPVPVKKAY